MKSNLYINVEKITEQIFERKKKFHHSQSKLPIEKKIRILVELQKIALEIAGKTKYGKSKRIWMIE